MKVVILAGGKSTSTFPVTRELMPKEFKKYGRYHALSDIFEEKKHTSTFQEAVLLALQVSGNVIVATKREYRFIVENQLQEINAAEKVEVHYDPPDADLTEIMSIELNGTTLFMPADVIVHDKDKLIKAIHRAEEAAQNHGKALIVTPILEWRPNQGYVRIEGEAVKEYRYGIPKDELRELDPNEWFIDTGFMVLTEGTTPDKTGARAIISTHKWREVDDYAALPEAGEKIEVNASNNRAYIEDGSIAAFIGVDNVQLISTGDMIVVASKDADGKKLAEALAEKHPDIVKMGPTVYKPWGRYTSIFEGPTFKIKILELLPGKSISKQRHYHRSEHWVIVEGTAEVLVGHTTKILRPGESVFVPIGEIHRLRNPGRVPLKVIEVQYGEYLGEDDIERLEDPYAREEAEKLL